MSTKLEKLKELMKKDTSVEDKLSKATEMLVSKMAMDMEKVKGDQGEPGYTPVKGKDYFTPDEIDAMVEYIQSNVKNGEDGETPVKGKDYFDGKNGETPTKGLDYWTKEDRASIVKETLSKIPLAKDGVSPKIEDIASKVMADLEKKAPNDKLVTKDELVNFLKKGGFRGGGASTLQALNDVSVGGQTNGQTLVWNSTTGKWEPGAGGGGGGHTIQDDGTPLAQRTNLDFIGFTVADDAGNDATKVTAPIAGHEISSDGGDILPQRSGLTTNAPLYAVDAGDGVRTVLYIDTAGTSNSGYLTAADWNTFNDKQSSSLTDSHILVGNGSGVATDVAVTGDVTISNTGVTTLKTSLKTDVIPSTFNGNGGLLVAGAVNYFTVPYACTIAGIRILATGSSPTCTVDIWKVATGTALPTVSNTICNTGGGGTKPALSTGNAVLDTTFTNWSTTTCAANDIVAISLDAVTISTFIKVEFIVTK